MAVIIQEWEDELDEEYGVFFRFSYSPPVIEQLKMRISSGCRRWVPDKRAWWVRIDFADFARSIITGEAQSSQPNSDKDQWAVLWLKRGAPFSVVRAAYRAMAALHHPDIGGDEEKMKEINCAYDALCKELSDERA
jgi:hypothetical protein